jgi:hypothetical protein
MGRNGALSIEEWRRGRPPLWVHSTNLLTTIGSNDCDKLFYLLCFKTLRELAFV